VRKTQRIDETMMSKMGLHFGPSPSPPDSLLTSENVEMSAPTKMFLVHSSLTVMASLIARPISPLKTAGRLG
jgi:hypothetical protein